ncbi:MAG: hypothetical protein IT260_11035 [Saprospiraceae bacterium]|nr:hypothetical protein [Saprospiraceae bacterium]
MFSNIHVGAGCLSLQRNWVAKFCVFRQGRGMFSANRLPAQANVAACLSGGAHPLFENGQAFAKTVV